MMKGKLMSGCRSFLLYSLSIMGGTWERRDKEAGKKTLQKEGKGVHPNNVCWSHEQIMKF